MVRRLTAGLGRSDGEADGHPEGSSGVAERHPETTADDPDADTVGKQYLEDVTARAAPPD